MLHTLKHIGIRLWLAILPAMIGSLVLLPVLIRWLPLSWWPLLFGVLLIAAFLMVGRLLHLIGRYQIHHLHKEARIWERAGNRQRALALYDKAISVVDSFLISPVARKQTADALIASMARFFLSHGNRGPLAVSLVSDYLEQHPEDTEVAASWLRQTTGHLPYADTDYELAWRVGHAHSENRSIQVLLARFYLCAPKTDFQALQTFDRLLQDPKQLDEDVLEKIAQRLYQEGRTDETALKAYLAAIRVISGRKHLIRGIAGCLYWAKPEQIPVDLMNQARSVFNASDAATITRLGRGFGQAPAETPQGLPRPYWKRIRQTIHTFSTWTNTVSSGIQSMGHRLHRWLQRAIQTIKGARYSRVVVKWGLIALMTAGIAWMAIHPLSHWLGSRKTVTPDKIPVQQLTTDPFTLQVAAYLKQKHAIHYVETLRQKGLDAYYSETQGVKTKWFQVRVSHFPTKDAARSFGESLKAQGVIDDFYVANYERP